jgi:hypothetical protein
MTKSEPINISFFIPSISRKIITGKIHWTKDDSITLEFENSLKKLVTFPSVEVIYGKTSYNEKLSLIGCFPSKSVGNSYTYSINEIHEGEWIKSRASNVYKKISAEITLLPTWYKTILQIQIPKDDKVVYSVNVLHYLNDTYAIDKNLSLDVIAYPIVKMNINDVTLESKARIEVTSKRNLSRNSLFQVCSSFLNLFSLFVRTKPYIEKIIITKRNNEQQEVIMNFIKPKNIGPTQILVSHKEIANNFQSILKSYYDKSEKYDIIIDRMRTINFGNEEQAFLILCRCIESFHKFFIQTKNDKEILKRLVTEFSQNGIQASSKNGWNQLLRYLHLYEMTRNYELFKGEKVSQYNWLNDMRSSRNYYTHPDTTDDKVWSFDELKRINLKLRAWLKALLFTTLNVPLELSKRAIVSETRNYIFLNHETNPYSIFSKKK